MAYIPKNKIKSNLYSNGEYAFIDPSQAGQIGDAYFGEYYTLATGEAFTGEYPGSGKNIPIRKRAPEGPQPDLTPQSLTTNSIPPLFPTPKDYDQGIFIRYFSKKRNEYLFNELTKDQYNTLNTPTNRSFELYKPFNIKWMLTGSAQTVNDYNRYTIKNAEEKEHVYGLDEYLKMNYIQYYKAPIQDNLYTSGKEYKTPNGEEYIGFYHTHPDKGPMVGATHSIESHSILIPINSTSQPLTGSQMMSNNIQPIPQTNYSPGGGSFGGSSY
jgi:hypothetical protein